MELKTGKKVNGKAVARRCVVQHPGLLQPLDPPLAHIFPFFFGTGTLIEQLRSATYECMVCCDNIRCEAAVWSCGNCYNVFHLRCVKKWARSPAAAVENRDGESSTVPTATGLNRDGASWRGALCASYVGENRPLLCVTFRFLFSTLCDCVICALKKRHEVTVAAVSRGVSVSARLGGRLEMPRMSARGAALSQRLQVLLWYVPTRRAGAVPGPTHAE